MESSGCTFGQVDVNSAPVEELDQIIHIGLVRAAELIQLRPFSSLDDLVRIKGIGPARLADIKEQGIACVGN
jgi:DNA uptake protein ComE-like DNA-binding protein